MRLIPETDKDGEPDWKATAAKYADMLHIAGDERDSAVNRADIALARLADAKANLAYALRPRLNNLWGLLR